MYKPKKDTNAQPILVLWEDSVVDFVVNGFKPKKGARSNLAFAKVQLKVAQALAHRNVNCVHLWAESIPNNPPLSTTSSSSTVSSTTPHAPETTFKLYSTEFYANIEEIPEAPKPAKQLPVLQTFLQQCISNREDCQRYALLLQSHKLEVEQLSHLTKENFDNIGITKIGDQLRITQHIKQKYRQQHFQQPPLFYGIVVFGLLYVILRKIYNIFNP